MYNKYLRSPSSTLVANKLAALATQLQSAALPGGTLKYQTLESVTAEARKYLSLLAKDLSAPLFTPEPVLGDMEPEALKFNRDFNLVGSDLVTLFAEFENLEGVMTGNFDYMISKLNRLHGRMKEVEDLLTTYKQYILAGNKDSIYLGDTFANAEYTDTELPSKDQLELDIEEGVITLPRKQKQSKLTLTRTPIINKGSNGVLGNNEEVEAISHKTLNNLLDGKSDTWVEYERVTAAPDGVALILDLTLVLDEDAIVNFAGINPYFFGAKGQIEVLKLETSLSGKEYRAIQDDMALEPRQKLILAPSSSKYAAQGLYSFLPRKIRYLHVVLSQKIPYIIKTVDNLYRQRYAIGLRDIWLEARSFKDEGEFISKAFTSSDEIRKVVIYPTYTPRNKLVTLTHYISPDDGSSWFPIKEGSYLDLNGSSDETIQTSSPVYSLRYRCVAKRHDDIFTTAQQATSEDEVVAITELHQPPTTTPFEITLAHSPLEEKVKLVDPSFGSRNIKETLYQISSGKGASGTVFQLPWINMKRSWAKEYSSGAWRLVTTAPEQVYVDNVLWSQASLAGSASTDEVYEINYILGQLKFGDGTNGKAPTSTAVISMMFTEERLFPGAKKPHLALLEYPTVADPKQIILRAVAQPIAATTVLQKGAYEHVLLPYITGSGGYGLTFSDTVVFATPQTFINGSLELTTAGDYSVDYDSGKLYSYSPTSSTVDTSVSYIYTPYESVDFQVVNHKGGLANALQINTWVTLEPAEPETIPTGVNYFNLENLAIAQGTLVFSAASAAFAREVPFINGRDELLGVTQVTEEISSLSSGAYPANVSFTLSLPITTTSGFQVSFSDTQIFVTEKGSLAALTSTGDYYVNKTTSTITVRIAQAYTIPGSVSYYFKDFTFNPAGRYSVNYPTGEIFCYTATSAGITITYQYTDYRVSYPISREVPQEDYEVDDTILTISDREILRATQTSQYTGSKASKFYQVSYEYIKSDESELVSLKEYYSPIMTQYFMKALPKGMI